MSRNTPGAKSPSDDSPLGNRAATESNHPLSSIRGGRIIRGAIEAISGENGHSTDDIDPLEAGLDDLLTALSNARRRYVVDAVSQLSRGETIGIKRLSRGLAYVENDDVESMEDLSTQQYKRVYVSLYQTHLDKLDAIGIIEYDSRAGAVGPTRLTDSAQEITQAAYREVSQWDSPRGLFA